MRNTLIASLALAAFVAAAGQAAAHASVKSTTPTDKASVASPEELDLTFSEALNLPFSKLHLLGPDGKEIEIGRFRASVDGHKTNGTYTFTVKP